MLLGIDLGTSSVKAGLYDLDGALCGMGMAEYPILTPQAGYAEQDPGMWWMATVQAVRAALSQVAKPVSVQAVGLSGQMHGGALLDRYSEPVGNAIIWPDQRSSAEVQAIRDLIGDERLARICGTAPATGFMNATLLWLLRHDPARLERIAVFLLPKDYLRYRLTGTLGTDASDGSATGLFDVSARTWSDEVIAALGLPRAIMPPVDDSAQVIGVLTRQSAEQLGLQADIPVVAGCADQAAQSIGNGLITPGAGSVTIGTGGQMMIIQDRPRVDSALRLHTFCHALPDRWYMLGAMLSAGMSLRWLRDTVGLTHDLRAYDLLSAEAVVTPSGADGLIFLPYLVGERSPLMDSAARGAFIGLTLRHTRGHMARAIMEGVAFGLRQILDAMRESGVEVEVFKASGNGLHSSLWRQIAADILNVPLTMGVDGLQAAHGAAILAGLGARVLDLSVIKTQNSASYVESVTMPDPTRVERYTKLYAEFTRLYPALRPIMHMQSQIVIL